MSEFPAFARSFWLFSFSSFAAMEPQASETLSSSSTCLDSSKTTMEADSFDPPASEVVQRAVIEQESKQVEESQPIASFPPPASQFTIRFDSVSFTVCFMFHFFFPPLFVIFLIVRRCNVIPIA
jgi:hypothetical protein